MRGQIYKRGQYYHCRYYDNSGKLYRKSTGSSRKREAEQFLREKEAEISSGSVPYQYDRFTFENMKQLYIDDLIDKDIKGMMTVQSNLKHLGEHFGGMLVTKIDSEVNEVKGRGSSGHAKTFCWNQEVASSMSFLQCLVCRG